MSYDLAVWEGARPSDDRAAAVEFQRLYDRYVASDDAVEPTSRIAAYVSALLERYPDVDTPAGRSAEISAWAVGLAEQHQLNCYDPQLEQLRAPATGPWRFELTSAEGRTFHDPDADTLRKVLVRLSNDNYFAILTRSDDWYMQAGYGQRAGTRSGWYALERQDGAPDRHFRAELTNIEDVVRAFACFLEDDTTLTVRHSWRPYAV